jgi:hypothetical protein
LPTFSQDRPNATPAAEHAVTHGTPYDVLTKADRAWRKSHGHSSFDGSYLSQSHSVWANQLIGLATVAHLANHINTSLTKIQLSRDGAHDDVSSQSDNTHSQEAPDWNFYDDDTGNTTHQYGEDDLVEQLFTNVEDEVFGSVTAKFDNGYFQK